MKRRLTGLALCFGLLIGTPLAGQAAEDKNRIVSDKYHVTAEERAACQFDAIELCSAAYPDEDKLLECMKLNRLNLSEVCRPVFEAGIKRRHLN